MRLRLITLAVMALALSGAEVALAFASPPSGNAPVTLRVHFGVVPGVVETNGPYTVNTRRSGAQVVLDETSGRRTRLRLPSGCRHSATDPILGDSWLLVGCNGSRMGLYSLARRRWRSVRVAPACAHFRGGAGFSCVPLRVGTDWIELDEESSHLGDVSVFQNIQTGRLVHDPTNATTFPDLDSRRLAQRLCRPLRVPAHTFAFFAFQGPFVLMTDEGGPTLERCGTRRRWGLSGEPLQAGIGPGVVMWTHGGGRGQLDGLFIPSLRQFRVTLPPHAQHVTYVQLSERYIYLSGATKHNLNATWSAPLPTEQPSRTDEAVHEAGRATPFRRGYPWLGR